MKLPEIQHALVTGKQEAIDPVAWNGVAGLITTVFTFFQSPEHY